MVHLSSVLGVDPISDPFLESRIQTDTLELELVFWFVTDMDRWSSVGGSTDSLYCIVRGMSLEESHHIAPLPIMADRARSVPLAGSDTTNPIVVVVAAVVIAIVLQLATHTHTQKSKFQTVRSSDSSSVLSYSILY